MLITVRVPDNKAAFFKKVVSEMSFEVKKTQREVPAETAAMDPVVQARLEQSFKDAGDYLRGKEGVKMYTMEEMIAELDRREAERQDDKHEA